MSISPRTLLSEEFRGFLKSGHYEGSARLNWNIQKAEKIKREILSFIDKDGNISLDRLQEITKLLGQFEGKVGEISIIYQAAAGCWKAQKLQEGSPESTIDVTIQVFQKGNEARWKLS